MAYCTRCNRTFPHSKALEQHRQASRNHDDEYDYFCEICSTLLDDEDEFLEHGEDYHYVCRPCIVIFASREALVNHDIHSHYYCSECDRFFQSAKALANHNASPIHQQRNIKCPGRKCGSAFASISALIMHAESNTCVSGITRKAVNTFVAHLDRQNIITNPARMITGPGGYPFPPAEPMYWATELSWNGRAYECFLCNGTFRTLQGLDSHLKSPRHLERIYHCPNSRCNKEYRALSALSQHVERGSCGARRISQIRDVMDTLNSRIRTITL
ncbi:hypothetical protein M0805_006739 [Coniferiporia weirii]|nr:hypothetical protein M0805_006739 [Coniferiporia weirii]